MTDPTCSIPDDYLVPKGLFRLEEKIRKSRFIASVGRANDLEGAKAFIREIQQSFPDATHNCWAFALDAPGQTARVGASDDGEPHGTAGRPILNALLHSNVGEAVVVVTRYFGGIKLGTGGLVRAYGQTAAAALAGAPLVEKTHPLILSVICGYPHVDALKRLVADLDGSIENQDFSADVSFVIHLSKRNFEQFKQMARDLTDGSILLEILDDPNSGHGTSHT